MFPWSTEATDAQSIADVIKEMLRLHNLGDLMCVAQAYDGASLMS